MCDLRTSLALFSLACKLKNSSTKPSMFQNAGSDMTAAVRRWFGSAAILFGVAGLRVELAVFGRAFERLSVVLLLMVWSLVSFVVVVSVKNRGLDALNGMFDFSTLLLSLSSSLLLSLLVVDGRDDSFGLTDVGFTVSMFKLSCNCCLNNEAFSAFGFVRFLLFFAALLGRLIACRNTPADFGRPAELICGNAFFSSDR